MLRLRFGLLFVVTLLLAPAPFACAAEPKRLVFEAEDYSTPKDAWATNQFTKDKWNLWSTDKDTDEKWSGGVVLQSPRVMRDRATPEEGAPVLHTRITGIPTGRWSVYLKNVGRVLAVSLDGGKRWRAVSGRRPCLGVFEIEDGTFDLWVDDRYASKSHPGSGYYDCLEFVWQPKRKEKPKVDGWAKERVWERIDRGLVALPTDDGHVYVGWRLLQDDHPEIAFDVYRCVDGGEPRKFTAEPIRKTTDFVDQAPPAGKELSYFVRPVCSGKQGKPSRRVVVRAGVRPKDHVAIELNGDHTFQKVGVADLNGDGAYDYVLKQPNSNIDPWYKYWRPSEGTYKIEAYLADGTFLWRRDLGWSIERGIWYSPYLVWDLDGDGKAEVVVKTGEGDPRAEDGRVTSGPEYVSVWDGMTGEERARVDWPSREGFPGDRKFAYNFYCRNQLGIAYLDGKTPCLLVARGTYNLMKVGAYAFHDGALKRIWWWENTEEDPVPSYRGQGAHFMHCADLDEDGRDEVLLGSCVLDDNGNGLWSTGLGHPDHAYLGDVDPTRPGLEIYFGMETSRRNGGMCLVDAKTGDFLWALQEQTFHIHSSGLCADFDPKHVGMECYGGEAKKDPRGKNRRWLFSAKGEVLARNKEWYVRLNPRAVYWDADPYRELLRGSKIHKFRGETLTESVRGHQAAWADVLGDWREEVITSVAGELRIYTTTIPAADRRVCLMQDPIHRIDVAHLAMGYAQPPMTTFCPSATEPGRRLAP